MKVGKSILKYSRLAQDFGSVYTIRLLLYKAVLKSEKKATTLIEKSLLRNYGKFLSPKEKIYDKYLNEKPYVWCMWWQGEDNMPDAVRVCYKSQRRFFSVESFQYVLITKSNYSQYIDIPKYIIEKVDRGLITLTHFSDIIRIFLLEKWGGLWIDSTLLFVKPLNKSYFSLPFYSVNLYKTKYLPHGYGQELTECRWAGFCLGTSYPHSELFKYLKDAIMEYWKIHDNLVDYFIMNRLILMAYNNNDYIKNLIDNVPISNINLYKLQPKLNELFNVEGYKSMIGDTEMFKISYKCDLKLSNNGHETYWGYLNRAYQKN